VFDSFIYNAISDCVKQPQGERNDLASLFIRGLEEDRAHEPERKKRIRDFVVNTMSSGHDVSSLLTFFVYLLSKNSHVEKKVTQEIDATLAGAQPDYHTLKNLPYLKAVIDETARLFPPIPLDVLTATADDTLPCGIKIPKNAAVFYPIYTLGRLETFWESPLECKPERWIGETAPRHVPPYIPFNYGPRACIGKSLAYLNVQICTTMILQRFRVHVDPALSTPRYATSTDLFFEGGLKVTVSARHH